MVNGRLEKAEFGSSCSAAEVKGKTRGPGARVCKLYEGWKANFGGTVSESPTAFPKVHVALAGPQANHVTIWLHV